MRTSMRVVGLQVYGFHGFFDEERSLGQRFLFDAHIELASSDSHLADHLDASVRYDELVGEIVNVSSASIFRTLEALAETTARQLLRRFEKIKAVTVAVTKASPPIQHITEKVSVEVFLEREEQLNCVSPS